MGADLYIEPNFGKSQEAFQPAFEAACRKRDAVRLTYGDGSPASLQAQEEIDELWGQMYSPETYYRDCYNSFSTLAAFGLSWWGDVIPLQTKKGVISKSKARKLAERIRDAEVSVGWCEEAWKHAYFENKPVTREVFDTKLKDYWRKDRDDLVRFLLAYANSESKTLKLIASL